MLLITKKSFKYILVLLFAFYFVGCTSKSYNTSSWTSGSNSNARVYKTIPKEKIRNSKAMHRATMRSYVIAGKRYHPTLAKVTKKSLCCNMYCARFVEYLDPVRNFSR